MGLEEHKAVVQRLFDAINTGRLDEQRFESEAIAIPQVADGRVTELRGTADRLGMLTQRGVLPDIG
jgi:hypothetical protein